MLVAAITTLGKTVLLIVAITFIVWSLITALWVPKRYPGFPRRLDLFIVLSAALFVAQMSAVVWVTGTQEVEHEQVAGGGESGEGTGTETGGEGTTSDTAGDAEAGKDVFMSAGCAACHTLADAQATGTIGPSLDGAKPSASVVRERVTNGLGAMPSFSGKLSPEQIDDVAAYVSAVAGAD